MTLNGVKAREMREGGTWRGREGGREGGRRERVKERENERERESGVFAPYMRMHVPP